MEEKEINKLISTVWMKLRQEADMCVKEEAILTSFFYDTILNQKSLHNALSFHLANKLDSSPLPGIMLREVIHEALDDDITIISSVCEDLIAINDRDPAAKNFSTPFLYYKGFHALQAYRIAHWLWKNKRKALALYLQNKISEIFTVDIHPAARIGSGILIDHATSVVVGETAVIDNNVSILHEVTLGGTGKQTGDRHPKIKKDVLIGAGSKILGNITIGEGAKIGAGSVVLNDLPPHVTAAGVPAKIIGKPQSDKPASEMDQYFYF